MVRRPSDDYVSETEYSASDDGEPFDPARRAGTRRQAAGIDRGGAGPEKDWYIIKVQSNREESIREGLLRRVKVAGLEDYFGEVIVPTETVTEFKRWKKTGRQAEAVSWLHRRQYGDHRGDLVFGPRDARHRRLHRRGGQALADAAAGSRKIVVKEKSDRGEAPTLSIAFKPGDRVKINEGTFENFEGEVTSIDAANGRVTVMINIFGRSTPVELEYWQVESM